MRGAGLSLRSPVRLCSAVALACSLCVAAAEQSLIMYRASLIASVSCITSLNPLRSSDAVMQHHSNPYLHHSASLKPAE